MNGPPRIRERLLAAPFAGYTYAYPHKTAYRPLAPPVPLTRAWVVEPQSSLFLYIHVPFCEMRCGFCNLFTLAKPRGGAVGSFLAALRRQAAAHAAALPGARYARFAIGGGTPTFLEARELAGLLETAEQLTGSAIASIPSSVETSPATATEDRLRVLRDFGISRLSIGVQSFTEAELRASARPQQNREVDGALLRIRSAGFPVLNIDLIYGLPEQTVSSWLASVRSALRYHPEELFLYPLYVRPLTGLGKSPRAWDDLRTQCYREARALLREAGYRQESMRQFRAAHAPSDGGPAYCVQDDGMVGLGCGARSYTRGLHYSQMYAVKQSEIGAIIGDYSNKSEDDFAAIPYGFALPAGERKRRYLLIGLLQQSGVGGSAYRERFGSELSDDFPELDELLADLLATWHDGHLKLTPDGMELSDAIGPWLYSAEVRAGMEAYEWR